MYRTNNFYTNSIYGILLIGVLNSFSDLFSKYVTLCVEPFIKFIVPESKMERALSVNFIVTSSISMFANFLGATPHKLIHTFATLAKEGNYGRGITSFNSF